MCVHVLYILLCVNWLCTGVKYQASGHDIEGEGEREEEGGGGRGEDGSKERKGNIFSISALLSQIALHCMTSWQLADS